MTARGRRHLLVLGLVVAAVTAQGLGLFGGGSPTVLAPAPLPLVLLVFLGAVPPFLLPLLTALVACLWSHPIGREEAAIPRRTTVLYVVALATSLAGFVVGWEGGVLYEGRTYTVATAALSATLAAATLFALQTARRRPSLQRSLLAHLLLFAWLVTYAYPYLGETP